MSPFVKEIGGAFARWFVSIVSGYLVANHYLSADASDQFSNAMLEHLLIYGPGVAALAWSLLAKYKGRLKFLAALQLPEGSSEHLAKVVAKHQGSDLMKTAGALLLVLLVAAPARAQQPPTAADVLDRIQATIDQARKDLTPPEPPKPVAIQMPEAFKAALAAAQPGDVLTLASSFVYADAVKVSIPITIRGETVPEGRMDRASALPSFRGGMEVSGDDVTLRAIEVRHTNPLTDILRVTGKHVLVDRVRVLGDPVKGAKRGIAGNGADLRILKSYVADCFGAYPGQDTQAFSAWDTPGPILLFDNYLSGGAETVMLGGADPSSEANIPSDVQILNNYIGADPAWQPLPIGVKSRLEIKNARRVLVQGNIVEYCWGKHGQDGYLLTLNVRNQDGRAPYSTIEDVLVYDNDFAHGAAGINILGQDNLQPSQRMARVTITGNRFADLDAVKYAGGVAKMILLAGGADDVTIDVNQFAGVGLSSAVYFGNGKYTNLNIRSNQLPKTTYKFFGNAIGADLAKITAAFITSGDLSNNLVVQ